MTSYDYKGIVQYEPSTGLIRWIVDKGRSRAGSVAGTYQRKGYIRISLSTDTGIERWQAHRLAWLIMTGSQCATEIDHINGIKDDNRWCNLRSATPSQNHLNPNDKIYESNTSGHRGVSFDNTRKKWRAHMTLDQQHIYLGRFDCKEDAIAAREEAMRPYWF
jgi:AP2 domain.